MCNLHWCYTFCTGITLFALVLHLNCTALSQSESSNFFMYIINNITKAKRALCDVAQFVAQLFDHCNDAYCCRQEYRPGLTTFDLFFTTISKTTK